MAKKVVWTEVQKINVLGKGLLKQGSYGSRDVRSKAKRKLRYDRKKED